MAATAASQAFSHCAYSYWSKSLQAYCAAATAPVSVHVHNYSGFAVRSCAEGESVAVEGGGVMFVLGADAWSSS